ncbi:MAG: hypothetical protein C4617_02515 [Candidatus Liberibacter europaeus]|uniref:UPF0235 protein C4617_02515 n=1 Tax=Candidatus Liberibacter europaeus TaxID=744859 RepID=A0A2T4VYJ0_9HYPH|nr:hypothetical protein [Candidatus Liberibacter europaeus]PTL86847.1 MAG: hypothetical protein C4617_02515 [Candidatus Liberibacter europaeus]
MCTINIHLIPNAKQSGIVSIENIQNGSINIKMKVTAPPQRGKANKEMIKILSAILSIRKSAVILRSGQSSNIKKIYIDKNQKELMELLTNSNNYTIPPPRFMADNMIS